MIDGEGEEGDTVGGEETEGLWGAPSTNAQLQRTEQTWGYDDTP